MTAIADWWENLSIETVLHAEGVKTLVELVDKHERERELANDSGYHEGYRQGSQDQKSLGGG